MDDAVTKVMMRNFDMGDDAGLVFSACKDVGDDPAVPHRLGMVITDGSSVARMADILEGFAKSLREFARA